MLNLKRISMLIALVVVDACAAACGPVIPSTLEYLNLETDQEDRPKTYQDLVVGFSQIGAESDWRTGNTASIKEEAERLGIELMFSDAQQEQENQIKAIRTFIAQSFRPKHLDMLRGSRDD